MSLNIKFNCVSNDTFFNNIDSFYNKSIPFIAFRKKNSDFVRCIKDENPRKLKSISDVHSGFVFMPFNKDVNGYKLELENSFSTQLKPKTIPSFIYPSIKNLINYEKQKKEYLESVTQIKKNLNLNFSKVVYTNIFDVEKEKTNPIRNFKNLLNLHLDALCYLFFHPDEGCWLGASPETLVNLDDNNLKTVALAGTKRPEHEGWSEKENTEQKIVEKYILDKLSPICKQIKITKQQTIKAGNVEHLKSTITAKTKCSPSELIDLIHPTPAVCGYPFDKAVKQINEVEKHSRSFYTGYLGLINSSNCETYVNLRCARIKDGKTTLYAGGGITIDSIAESEWNEIVSKTETILKIFSN